MIKTTLAVTAMLMNGALGLAAENTVAAPVADVANYDPTLSAKEAVLANWELAAAGIRAGRVVGDQVIEMAQTGASYGAVLRQAQFAQKTMVQRYNAAFWVYTVSQVDLNLDPSALTEAVRAANTPCSLDDCADERTALLAAFQRATSELDKAAIAARTELTRREGVVDAVLMTEQLALIADYLEDGTWAEGFSLTEFGRDGEELAARIVGAMALWRNIEPYVGLADKEIDTAINAKSRDLLRTMRTHTRSMDTFASDSPELEEIKAAALALSAEFRKASELFSS